MAEEKFPGSFDFAAPGFAAPLRSDDRGKRYEEYKIKLGAHNIKKTTMKRDRFSRIVFLLAGIYGIGVLVPGFFSESMTSRLMPRLS